MIKTKRSFQVPTWGRPNLGTFRCWRMNGEKPVDSAVRSIVRRLKLTLLSCQSRGTVLDGFKPVGQHYCATLGRPIANHYGGGYAIVGEIWFAVPA